MKQAKHVAELILLVVALAITMIADYLPTTGKYAGRIAGRLYRHGLRIVSLAYAYCRYGRPALIYLADLLELHSPQAMGWVGLNAHCRTVCQHASNGIEWPIPRALWHLLVASYGYLRDAILNNALAQCGTPVVPVTIDPVTRRHYRGEQLEKIRQIMTAY